MGERADAIAGALADVSILAGDRICTLGFTSVDYMTVEMAIALHGGVSVPLQTGAQLAQLQSIATETEPTVIVAGVDYLPVAVDVALPDFSQ